MNDSKTEHREIMPDLQKDFPERLRKMVYLLDEPVDGPPVLSKFEINKFIKECGITVALTGQGADELLGGYKRFLYSYIKSLKNPIMLQQFIINTNPVGLLSNVYDHLSLFMNDFSNVVNKLFRYDSQKFKASLFSHSFSNFINNENLNEKILL